MTANPKVVEAVMTALLEALENDELGYVRDDGGGDYRIDVAVNLPQLVAHLVSVGQTPVDRVLGAWQRSRRALVMPDRDDLAREMFMKDNSNGRPKHLLNDWIDLSAHGDTYAHRLADVAIATFRAANS